MNKYVFYTSDGFCEDPNGNPIDNCQLLGWIKADSKEEAIDRFLAEDGDWVLERGYRKGNLRVAQLSDNENLITFDDL